AEVAAALPMKTAEVARLEAAVPVLVTEAQVRAKAAVGGDITAGIDCARPRTGDDDRLTIAPDTAPAVEHLGGDEPALRQLRQGGRSERTAGEADGQHERNRANDGQMAPNRLRHALRFPRNTRP